MEFTLSKPNIDSAKILTKEEAVQVETALKRSGAILIHPNSEVVKNDYIDDHNRGTVKFNTKMRNYAFHKVIIPDGTIVKDCNFSQKIMNTDAISGKNLVFEFCNLRNCKIDLSWTLKSCNTYQSDLVFEEVKDGS
jgi:hypothetical protein